METISFVSCTIACTSKGFSCREGQHSLTMTMWACENQDIPSAVISSITLAKIHPESPCLSFLFTRTGQCPPPLKCLMETAKWEWQMSLSAHREIILLLCTDSEGWVNRFSPSDLFPPQQILFLSKTYSWKIPFSFMTCLGILWSSIYFINAR